MSSCSSETSADRAHHGRRAAAHRRPGAAHRVRGGAPAGAARCTYLHTGGTWAYGDTDGMVDEDAPLAPSGLVAWREANEKQVLARPGRPVLIMPGLIYGNSGGLLEHFYAMPGRAAGTVPCVGDGANHWSMAAVAAVAELYVLALDAPAGRAYAGVGDTHPTQREVLEALATAIGRPGQLEHLKLHRARDPLGRCRRPSC